MLISPFSVIFEVLLWFKLSLKTFETLHAYQTIYKLQIYKNVRWFNIGCACNVRSKFARTKGENFAHSWFRSDYAFPRQLNGIMQEFNANLTEFKVTYSVNDRQICFLKHKETFSKVKFWNRWNYLLFSNIKFYKVISLYIS